MDSKPDPPSLKIDSPPGKYSYFSKLRVYPQLTDKLQNHQQKHLEQIFECLRISNSPGSSDADTKILFLARHGQGVHNVAEEHYGRQEWDDRASKLEGEEPLGKWLDAELTPKGVEQVTQAGVKLKELFMSASNGSLERFQLFRYLPQRFYISPLTRCMQTAQLSWTWLWEQEIKAIIGDSERPKPVVREMLRETMGVHTCDKRSTASVSRARFPEYIFEEGMSEEDELWDPEHRETDAETDVRVRAFLDNLWDEGKGIQVVSLTAHSGWIKSALRILNYSQERVETGGILTVLVRGRRHPGYSLEKEGPDDEMREPER